MAWIYVTRFPKILRQRLIRLTDQTPHWLKVAIHRRMVSLALFRLPSGNLKESTPDYAVV
jgi:uncharacterized heparinase superfamily protein